MNENKVAIIGGGVIGASWAVNFARFQYEVAVYVTRAASIPEAQKKVRASLDSLLALDVMSAEEAEAIAARIQVTASLEEAIRSAFFIQECAPDRMDLKKTLLAQIEAACPTEAIISSSTSNLLISEMAAEAVHPERIIGGHPFNPPHLIPLVEVSKGQKTSDQALARAVAFYKACGKAPAVLQKESIGFIANRLQMALFREAADMVLRGVCTVADVDAATTYGPGMRWAAAGPHLIYQLGGGASGFRGLLSALQVGGDTLLNDLADWKSMPREYLDIGQDGVNEEMAELPETIGRSNEEIARFRDKILVELLKLHNKL